jgi:eukaryotic-like serine/threonine-protein kinase
VDPLCSGLVESGAGKDRIGRYRLFHPLAAGGTATVYLGCLRSGGGFARAVAIKKLHDHLARDERLVAALLTEARIVSRIRHPNVVSVLDVVAEPGQELIVLDYVHGESLSQLLRSEPDIPLGVALRIVVDTLDGLHAVHEATNELGVPLLVVHRDVSPQNIMVDVDGRARLVDFGVAKALERPFTTNTSEFRGKLGYAAPEQIVARKVDRRTDVWATGMVLWELIVGRRYFGDADAPQIVYRICEEEIVSPSDVRACPSPIDAIVRRALERDPDLRFGTAREMALALEKAGPPLADHREVARWVKRVAEARLDERTALMSEMEVEARRAPAVLPQENESSLPKDPAPSTRRLPLGALVLGVGVIGVIGVVVFAFSLLGRRGGGTDTDTSATTSPLAATSLVSTPPTDSVTVPSVMTSGAPPAPSVTGPERRHGRAPARKPAPPSTAKPTSPSPDDLGMDQRH